VTSYEYPPYNLIDVLHTIADGGTRYEEDNEPVDDDGVRMVNDPTTLNIIIAVISSFPYSHLHAPMHHEHDYRGDTADRLHHHYTPIKFIL